jgi:hypothetical protein
MDKKLIANIAISCLIIAVGIIVLLDIYAQKSGNFQLQLQTSSIVFLMLLSLGLFYVNNKKPFAEFYKNSTFEYLGYVMLLVAVLGLVGLEIASLYFGNVVYYPPIGIAFFAIGLYLSNLAINQPET